MKKQIEKGSAEWQMFGELFKLYQEYGTPEGTDEYWKAVIKAFSDFGTKYLSVSNGLSLNLSFTILDHLDKTWRESKR